jgi:hypothetical protein
LAVPGDDADTVEVLNELHQQTISRLSGLVPRNDFRIDRELGCLRVPGNCERNGVRSVAAKVIADQINGEWGESAVAEFLRSEAESGREKPRYGNILANPPPRGGGVAASGQPDAGHIQVEAVCFD